MGFALLSQYFGRCISYFKGIHKFPERSLALVEMERGIIGLNGLKPGEKGWIERMTLVEVTAHPGARPSHQLWQGRVYSRSGKSKKYENLYAATRLGEVDGLCGANCRHNYYGYVEGSPRAWSDEELENIDPPPFMYGGKKYTYYEAGQRMRYMERQIRKTKREAVGYEAAGLDDDFTAASIKLNRQRQEYRRFARASGIRPKWERTQELGYNRSVSSKAVHRARNGGKQ